METSLNLTLLIVVSVPGVHPTSTGQGAENGDLIPIPFEYAMIHTIAREHVYKYKHDIRNKQIRHDGRRRRDSNNR